MKKLLSVTLLSSFFLVACGGSESQNTEGNDNDSLTPTESLSSCIQLNNCSQEDIERAYSLPEEPTSITENYYSEEGSDINEKNGRDDIERAITFKYYKDENKVLLANKVSELTLTLISAIKSEDSELYWNTYLNMSLHEECFYYLYGSYIDTGILEMSFDTNTRNKLFLKGDRIMKNSRTIPVGYSFSESDLESKCNNL